MKRRYKAAILAIAVLAMAAAFSTASASAGTVVCNSSWWLTTCPESGVQPAGSTIALSSGAEPGGKFTLKAGLLNTVSCKSATLSAKSSEKSGTPLKGQLAAAFGSACTAGSESNPSCTSISANAAPETIEATGSGGGTVRIGTEASPMTLSFDCFNVAWNAQIACTYRASNVLQTVTPREENAPEVKITEVTMTKASQTKGPSEACTATAKLNMVGAVVGENYMSHLPETVFCESAVTTCPASEVKPAESYVATISNPEPGFKGKFTLSAGPFNVPSCPSATFAHKSKAISGSPLAGELTAGVGTGCTNSAFSGSSCSSISINNAPESIAATGGGGGTVTIGTALTPLTISFTCQNSYWKQVACTYQASSVLQTLTPRVENTPEAKITNVKMTKVSQTEGPAEACGATATLNYVGAVITASTGEGYISKY